MVILSEVNLENYSDLGSKLKIFEVRMQKKKIKLCDKLEIEKRLGPI